MTRYFSEHYKGRAASTVLIGYEYQLLRCRSCGLAYQRAVPDDWLLGEVYDKWIPPVERMRLRQSYNLDDYRYWAEQVEFLIQYLRKPPHAVKVLDFGLGWAEWACMAQAYGCEVYGSELSAERAKNAQLLGIPILSLDELSEHRFNFINTEQVLEHLTDPGEILGRLAVALAPGGFVKLSVPDARVTLRRITGGATFASLAASDVMPIAPLEHINSFQHDSLLRLAAQFGLRVVRPSFVQLWNSASGWFMPRRAAKLFMRPFFRHVYPKSTIVYFTKGK